MEFSERDLLIDDVQHGRKTPNEAEAEAEGLGFGPLACKPDPTQFDPMQEVWWTLPMTVAWIFWRSPDQVREYWDAYRDECLEWHFKRWHVPGGPVFEGHFLEQRRRASLTLLFVAASYDEAHNLVPPGTRPIREAKDALWKYLAEGTVQASAVSSLTHERETIPRDRWLDLDAYEERGRDELHPRAGSVVGWCRYRDVRFERSQILAHWFPRQSEPTSPLDPQATSPSGDGYMPLYCAAHWIATLGNAVDVQSVSEAAWIVAYRQLLEALASERVKVIGVRDGNTEPVPGYHFASCRVQYPYGAREDGAWLKDEVFLRSYAYINDQEWRGGFDDRLTSRRGDEWIRLMVPKADVAAIWPFDLVKPEAPESADLPPTRTGAPGRPSLMYLVEAEHRRRCAKGEAEKGINAEARVLSDWLAKTHPHGPQLKPKSIANKIRADHRALRDEAQN